MHLNIFAGIHLYGVTGGPPVDIASRYLWFHAVLRVQFKKKPGIFHKIFLNISYLATDSVLCYYPSSVKY